MAVILVSNIGSSGSGSLAEAVTQANATAGADIITFVDALAGQTVVLSGMLTLSDDVTINGDINGDGDADIDISGGDATNLIAVTSGVTAALTSLTLRNGLGLSGPSAVAGAILNQGTLALSNCLVADNQALAPFNSGRSSGTVVNTGTLTITDTMFSGNSSKAGSGVYQYGANGGNGSAAGTILNQGTLSLTDTNFSGNTANGGKGGDGSDGRYIFGTLRNGYNGGNGGAGVGCVLNTGTMSGSFQDDGTNNGYGGLSGIGGEPGFFGNNGLNGGTGAGIDGTFNAPGGTGLLTGVDLGTMASDTLTLDGSTRSVLNGLGGDDVLTGAAGKTVRGGTGDDTIHASGAATVEGGLGNDALFDDAISGGSWDGGQGSDTLNLSANFIITNVSVDLGAASFTINAAVFSHFENVVGTTGGDTIFGGNGRNTIDGFSGNDTITGGKGGDRLIGGDGSDTLSYAASLSGVSIDLAARTATGGDATGDRIGGFENVTGSNAADALSGSGAANTLTGNNGDDTLLGLGGADRFVGGGGHDTLTGGLGDDTFVLRALATDADTILDFKPSVDHLEISTAIFAGLLMAGAPLPDGAFRANSAGVALDADDRFLLSKATGELFFDADGNGVGEKVLIADFGGLTPRLSAADFIIV